jgi:hypothetical protein
MAEFRLKMSKKNPDSPRNLALKYSIPLEENNNGQNPRMPVWVDLL